MDDLIRAITQLVERGLPARAPRARPGLGERPEAPRALEVDLAGAPAAAQELARALAANYYNVRLAEFSLYENGVGNAVRSLEPTIAMACERGEIDPERVRTQGGPGGGPFDPAATLELGGDRGGMSYLGVTWSGGKLDMVLVELEDPIQDNLLLHFTSAAELFAFLDERSDGEEKPDVTALKAAVAAG